MYLVCTFSAFFFFLISYCAFLQVWNLETLQCVQILEEHTSVVMSVLCWDQFLLSCSLDKTIKVHVSNVTLYNIYACIYLKIFLYALGLQLFLCVVCAGVGCYRKWEFGSNIHSQCRTCMWFMIFYLALLPIKKYIFYLALSCILKFDL